MQPYKVSWDGEDLKNLLTMSNTQLKAKYFWMSWDVLRRTRNKYRSKARKVIEMKKNPEKRDSNTDKLAELFDRSGIDPAVIGQRYLLTEATGSENGYAEAWAGTNGAFLIANANDIIEYTSDNRWVVSFDSTSSLNNNQYVTNITTSIQYRWTGETWVKSYQGLYPGGTWNLVL